MPAGVSIVGFLLALAAFNYEVDGPRLQVLDANGIPVPKGESLPPPFTFTLQDDPTDEARYDRELVLLTIARVAFTFVAATGFLMHMYGIYIADRSLRRREQFQCERCGYDLRGRPEATHCPECGQTVRGFPSARSQ